MKSVGSRARLSFCSDIACDRRGSRPHTVRGLALNLPPALSDALLGTHDCREAVEQNHDGDIDRVVGRAARASRVGLASKPTKWQDLTLQTANT